jgi:hypothetical protein
MPVDNDSTAAKPGSRFAEIIRLLNDIFPPGRPGIVSSWPTIEPDFHRSAFIP